MATKFSQSAGNIIYRKLSSLTLCSAYDNAKFVSGGGDRIVFYWDVATGQTIRRIPGHNGRINAVALNEDASVIVSGTLERVSSILRIELNF